MTSHESSRGGRLGTFSGMLLAALLVLSLGGLFFRLPGLGPRNWLVVLFQINAGIPGLPPEPLLVFNPLDIVVLTLAGLTFLGLRPHLRHMIWTGLAIALPFAGIAVLFLTGEAGRSGLMGGGLVISFVMLADRRFKPLGYLGIVANGLLFAGDLLTTGSPAPGVAAVLASGYVLLIAWFALIAVRLLTQAPVSENAGP